MKASRLGKLGRTRVRIKILTDGDKPSEVLVFHHCGAESAQPFRNDGWLINDQLEVTKVLDRIKYEDFLAKKFKPIRCKNCKLKMDANELIFEHFKDLMQVDK